MNSASLAEFYLNLLLQLLATPTGIVALFLGIVLAIATVTVPALRWWCVAGAIYVSTLPINAVNYREGDFYVPLAFPLEQIRLYARPLTLFFLAMLVLPFLASAKGWRTKVISLPLALFFLFQVCLALRLAVIGGGGRGVLSLMSYGLLMLTFGVAVGRWLQSLEDVYKLLYAICGAGGMVVVATCYQLTVNRSPIMAGNRLSGVTGNPQFLAVILAITIPIACLLMLQGRKSLRPVFAALVAVGVVLLIWTGSRTGMLGLLTGVLVLFHRRIARFLLAVIVVGALIYFALPIFEGSTINLSRFVSTENTRQVQWEYMANQFTENVWMGAARGEMNVVENSYLSMLGQLGIVGTLPFIAAMIVLLYQTVRLQLSAKLLGPQRQLVELMTAFWATVAITAMFEGFLLGVLVFAVLLIYLFAGMTKYLSDHVAAVRQEEQAPEYEAVEPWQVATI